MSPQASGDKAIARFRITPDEYAEGMRKLIMGQITFWIGPVAAAFLLVVAIATGQVSLGIFGAVFVALAVLSLRVVPAKKYKQSPQLATEQTHTFSADGILIYAGGQSGTLPWEFYKTARETPRVYLLMKSPKQANFIPKRGFNSPEDEQRFRALAAERLKASWG